MTDNIKLPPHKPTWAIKETLDKYLSTDDREYVWESIRAYANVQARAAVEADRAQRVVNQSLTAEPGFMEIRELWGASTEAMGGDGLEAMQHFARIVLARYGQPARPVNVPPASISRDLLGRIVDEVFGSVCEDTSAIEGIYRVIVREYGLPAASAEPVATLHDDGHYTFKRQPAPYGSDHAGWQMDVFAAPVAAQPSMPNESAALDYFEQRFNEIEEGDGEIPLPRLGDGRRWDEYVERHRAALTGWVLRRDYEQSQRSVDKAWARFQAAAPTPPAVEQAVHDVLSDVVTQGIGIMRIDPTDIYQSSAKQRSMQAAIDAARKE